VCANFLKKLKVVISLYCIVGADGFLGTEFLNCVLRNSSEFILAINHVGGVYPDSDRIRNLPFELSDEITARRVAEELSAYTDIKILHLACVHHPDVIKQNPERAGYLNTVCYEAFLEDLKGLDITKFIYASSDTVYGENRFDRPFRETDELMPVNIYGSQKKAAEEITLRHGFDVVRLPYMSGASATPRKKHFFDTLAENLRSGREISMLTDYVRSSLSYAQAADLIFRIFESGTEERIINVCADFPTDKYTIGLLIARWCGAPESLVKAVTSAELGIFDEYRANILTMDNSLMKRIIGCNEPIILNYGKEN